MKEQNELTSAVSFTRKWNYLPMSIVCCCQFTVISDVLISFFFIPDSWWDLSSSRNHHRHFLYKRITGMTLANGWNNRNCELKTIPAEEISSRKEKSKGSLFSLTLYNLRPKDFDVTSKIRRGLVSLALYGDEKPKSMNLSWRLENNRRR